MANNNLYIVTSYFNPCGFESRKRLFTEFASRMADAGVPLLTVEAAFGSAPHEVTVSGNPWHVQLRTDAILWHKERMLNLGVWRLLELAPDAQFLGLYDADISFSDPHWVPAAVRKLMQVDVIQPFSVAVNLNARSEYMWHCPSTFAHFINTRGYHQTPDLPAEQLCQGHPGLAWCMTVKAFEGLGGLYDRCAAGSGDTVMANCLKGHWDAYLPETPSGAQRQSMQAWAAKCDAAIRGRVGYIPGTVMHHWHGASEERGYERRWAILSYHNYDPHTDLELDRNGLYRWAGNKPRLEDDIRLSLTSRNEDAT